MSRLRELVDELCPDGVEYRPVKELYTKLRGTPITAATMKKIAKDDGDTIIYAGGKTIVRANESDIPKANVIRKPSVVVQSRGVIDFIYCEEPFTFKNEMWAYTCNDIDSVKYLRYALKSNVDRFRVLASAMSSLPQIAARDTEEFRIPVPPIEVQREVVRILDSFQELDDALTAEIEAREKQLDWFRAKIYSSTKYPSKPLSFIGTFERGRRFTRAEMGGEATPCIHYGDIYTKCDYWADEPLDRLVAEKPNLRYAHKGDVVVAATSENAEDVCKAIVWLGNEDAAVHDDCQILHHDQNPFYLSFFFNSEPFMESKMRFVTESKVVRISGDEMGQIELPLPPTDVQSSIAESLLAFVAHTNAIKAERDARRKQFEHYRDKLLSFPVKEA